MHYLNMWFRQNLGLKIISVFIAFGLWAYVMVRENPAVTREVEARVVLRNKAEGLTVLGYSPRSVRLELVGLRRLVQDLSPNQMTAVVDLSEKGVGEHTVPVTPPQLPQGVTLQAMVPATVRVVLDRLATETHVLSARLRGEPAAGFALGTPQLSRTEAKVTGAASALARLSQVIAEADVSGLNATSEVTAPVHALDQHGDPIEGLEVSPAQVVVVVPVTRAAQASKTLPVRPQTGTPAEGYEVREITVRPEQVTVTGNPAALAALESVSTEMIPLADLTAKQTYRVKLVLPAGVKRSGEGPIEVTVTVGKRSEAGPGTAPPGRTSPAEPGATLPSRPQPEPGESASSPSPAGSPARLEPRPGSAGGSSRH